MNKREVYQEGLSHGYDAATYVEVGIDDTDLETWFERDRAHVDLRDKDGNTIYEWWDDAVEQAIQDGFLRMHPMGGRRGERALHESAFEYAEEMGFFPTEEVLTNAAYEAEMNARQYSPWEFIAQEINDSDDPEELWEQYERGVTAGIQRGVRERIGPRSAGGKIKKRVREVVHGS
jgi:hypothetical protein